MISEFSMTPRPSNNKARHLFFIFLIIAVAVGAVYVMVPTYKGVIGLVCLLFVVSAIYVYNRYMAIIYHYDVLIDASGTPLLIIRHSIGKRDSTLCRVELASIESVKLQTAEERKAHKTPEGCVRYFYSPTLSPDVTCLVTIHSHYEYAEITLEGSEELAGLLERYSREARGETTDNY